MATDALTTLKSLAKKLARLRCLQHIAALDFVAREVGKDNWRSLTEAYTQGWRPDAKQMGRAECLLAVPLEALTAAATIQNTASDDRLVFTSWVPEDVEPMEADELHGELDGHKFYLVGDESASAFWLAGLGNSPRPASFGKTRAAPARRSRQIR